MLKHIYIYICMYIYIYIYTFRFRIRLSMLPNRLRALSFRLSKPISEFVVWAIESDFEVYHLADVRYYCCSSQFRSAVESKLGTIGERGSALKVGANYYTRNHKSEIPLENTAEHPFDNSSKNPLDKWLSFGNGTDLWNSVGKFHWQSIGQCHWTSTMISEVSISGVQSFAPNLENTGLIPCLKQRNSITQHKQ